MSTLENSLHYDPDMLPLAHLAERLESLAAGLPAADGRSTAAEAAVLVEAANRSSELIVRALTAAAGGSTAAVWKVYKPLVYREQGHTVPATPMDSYRTNAAVRRVKVQLLQ
ncbi:hypothetical protein Vretifemale_20753 [Volvox reticuliferus]|nr:hypothetical protein Vretifemale_20753 [Volvox reticuliferus]